MKLTLICLLLAIFCLPVQAQPLIDPARITRWKPGVTYNGGIPARTAVCATVNPSGGANDAPAIQAAIDACPAGLNKVVQLTAGSFTIAEGDYVLINKDITVRGSGAAAGPTQTLITRIGGAAMDQELISDCPGFPGTKCPTPHFILGPARFVNPGGDGSVGLSADGVKGSMSVTVPSVLGFSVGQIVLLDELSGAAFQTDPAGRGQICASPDFLVVWQLHNPPLGTDDPLTCTSPVGGDAASWFSRQDRPTNELKRIASITGAGPFTITFESPLHTTYRVSHTAQLYFYGVAHVFGAALESMKIQNGDNGNVRFHWCANCWMKSVDKCPSA